MANLWSLPLDSYKGLRARCAPGLHPAAVALLARHPEVPRAAVLDLASGSGSLLARLRDNGFTDLHAVELDVPKFQIPDITPLPLDLNQDFSAQLPQRYNLITAIEIVEHLDSPRHFLQSTHRSLNNDGFLLLSTPNIASWIGRIKFLLTGIPHQFAQHDYDHNHHVSPIPHLQMLQMFHEIGFTLVEHTAAGSFFGPLKRLATLPLSLPFRLIAGPESQADVNLYLARKSAPPQKTLPGDWTR